MYGLGLVAQLISAVGLLQHCLCLPQLHDPILLRSVFHLPTLMCKSLDACGRFHQPSISRPVQNISAEQGDDVTFSCHVKHTGRSLLAWVRSEPQSMLIAWESKVFRSKHKYKIATKQDVYELTIRNVMPSDAGSYMCQINTSPMIESVGYLTLRVPPIIRKDQSSKLVAVREGQNATMRCLADGSPPPKYTWMREPLTRWRETMNDAEAGLHAVSSSRLPLIYEQGPGKGGASSVSVQNLTLRYVGRQSSGPYNCYASNGILPNDVWTVHLNVHFPPIAYANGGEVVRGKLTGKGNLGCRVEASPRASVTWRRAGKHEPQYLLQSHKFTMHNLPLNGPSASYESLYELQINDLVRDDFTVYVCMVKNEHGSTEATVTLKEEPSYFVDDNSASNSGQASLYGDDEDVDNVVPVNLMGTEPDHGASEGHRSNEVRRDTGRKQSHNAKGQSLQNTKSGYKITQNPSVLLLMLSFSGFPCLSLSLQ